MVSLRSMAENAKRLPIHNKGVKLNAIMYPEVPFQEKFSKKYIKKYFMNIQKTLEKKINYTQNINFVPCSIVAFFMTI